MMEIAMHKNGHLRDAFDDAVEACSNWESGQPEPIVDVRDSRHNLPISQVAGLLWHCTDVMPGAQCEILLDMAGPYARELYGQPSGWTYAKGARVLKEIVRNNIHT